MRLKGKTAIITGAAHGIGKAAVERFAEEGAALLLSDVDAAASESLTQELRSRGTNAHFMPADLEDEGQIEDLFAAADRELGKLDILYNNAGYERLADVHELSVDDWRKQIRVNLEGTFLTCRLAVLRFLNQGGGVILNTSSISGQFPTPQRPAYNAAKGGVIMLTRNLARQYAERNIRANVICPGVIQTRMTTAHLETPPTETIKGNYSAMGRMGEPSEVANAALFLVSDEASFVTGTAFFVDGGLTLGAFWP